MNPIQQYQCPLLDLPAELTELLMLSPLFSFLIEKSTSGSKVGEAI